MEKSKMDASPVDRSFTHLIEVVETGDLIGQVYLGRMFGEEWVGQVRLVPHPADKKEAEGRKNGDDQ